MSSAPVAAPFTRNWTPATPTLSEAVALSVTVPETVVPAAGAVIDTVGGVVSGGAVLLTVTVMAVLVVWFPAASRARGRELYEPFATAVVFQFTE